MAKVASIPAHRSFADALSTGLLRTYGADGLARGRILLPTNRAVRTLTEAFVRLSGGGLLLPRLIPIGDPELGDRIGAALDHADSALPPAIPALERQLKLASMLAEGGRSAAEALRLAADLGRTLDTLEVEQVEPAALRALASDSGELAAHWERMLGELSLLFTRWPEALAEDGLVDLARRRNLLLGQLERRWKDDPPPGFTIAAGITTTAPAVAGLLRRISRLPGGQVVLPALAMQKEMPDAEWDALIPEEGAPEVTHPQYHLRLLLDRMGVSRAEVETWGAGGRGAARAERGRAAANAMASARFSDKWNRLDPPERRVSGVRAMELPDPASEAMAIAIALREAIEEDGATAALVTPDRALAGRTAAILRRWGIEADDSAGRPLLQSPPGSLLAAMIEALADQFAPVPLLALLKHPLVGGEGEARGEWLAAVRRLDIALRGPRPEEGIKGIDRHIARLQRGREEAEAAWTTIRPLLDPLDAAFASVKTLADLMAAMREGAQILAADRVWKGTAGRQAAELIARVETAPQAATLVLERTEWPTVLGELFDGETVRPSYGGHPRIQILGLLEARLQQSDLMIMGGLNEGSWPPTPSPDPWLAPRLRRDLGLPPLDYRIGLAAHDFMSALGAPRVLISRALRDGRAPTVASRFWLRLEAMTDGITRETRIPALAAMIDKGAPKPPFARPAPAPPAADRPGTIYVTDVDRLKADPFAYYAKSMLRLRPLDPVDAEHHAAWKGSAVHDVLEAWFKQDNCDPATLRHRAETMVSDDAIHPMLRALWRPRLLEAIDWIAERTAADQRAGRTPIAAEAQGSVDLAGVRLKGIADRIDRSDDGLVILDYKTGKPPTFDAVNSGYRLQLTLLGVIAEDGGFGTEMKSIAGLEYWSLAKNKEGGQGYRQPASRQPIDDLLQRTRDIFRALAAGFLTGSEPFKALVHPEFAPYGDYDQLMRRDEWYGRE
ncbi:double-strand break repair protein AddB [Sphingomicrobium marinum]|uniref:double-strand break repair protein AddB n=1 Tax=Sphingomicrobium marinum TaxID=1227950 RepID=UPI00223F1058|nr:double-strand break repair protein AddB [Sphingomicrobium marinum]